MESEFRKEAMIKQTRFGDCRVGLLALTGLALLTLVDPAGAQTLTPQFGDLILGFRATGAPGQSYNLEVDLGNMSQFYNATPGSTIPLPGLSVQDLINVYGSGWSTRADLWWGAISTTGRASGTSDGHAPADTLWATRPVGQPAWNRAGKSTQATSSAVIEPMIDPPGAVGSLYGASVTTNSSEAAVINATVPGSWTYQEASTAGESFSHFNPTIDNAASVSATGIVSALYELQPTNSGGVAGTLLGNLILTASGLSFQAAAAPVAPTAGFSGSPTNGVAPLTVSFLDSSTGTITNRLWSFGDGTTTNATNPTHTYTTAGTYSVTLTAYGPGGSGTLTLTNYIVVTAAPDDVQSYIVAAKGQNYSQTDASTVILQVYGFGLHTEVQALRSNAVASVALELPGGAVTNLTASSDTVSLSADMLFLNKTSLDSACPAGTYTLTVATVDQGSLSSSLNLPADDYPHTPQIANFAAAQAVAATNDFTLTWTAFTGGTASDYIHVEIDDTSTQTVFQTPGIAQAGSLNGTNTAVLIPANTLAPGTNYIGRVMFYQPTASDTNSIPGALGSIGYYQETWFNLSTSGTLQPQPPTITTSSPLPSGTVGTAYAGTLAATGGTQPYTWSVVSNGLPAGLGLVAATGAITGTPTVATTTNFTVQVQGADGLSSMKSFTLTINPAASRIIVLSGNLAFGNVSTGATATATLTIANSGNSVLTVTSISYPAGFSGAFSGAIAAGGSTNVTVTFAPTALTSYGGTITVNSDATSGTSTIGASGTGVLLPTRIISLSGTLSFGNVTTGATATARLTIANAGNTNLTVASISYPSGFSGAFSGAVAAGGVTNLTVTFAPTALTSYGGTITVNSDATSGTSTISASGTGVSLPTRIISLSGNLAFGNVTTGTTATASLTIANTGSTNLTIASISYPNGFSGAFNGIVAAGSATNVTVTFAPTALISYGGTITASSDATGGTGTIVAFGAGAAAPTIVTPSLLPTGTVGQVYSQQLAATGGTTPYQWSVAAGRLPSGLTLSVGGVIGGTPLVATNVSFNVRVTDSSGRSSVGPFSLAVQGAGVSGYEPGRYDGLTFLTNNVGGEIIGYARITVTKRGAFRAQIKLNGATYVGTGQFNFSGDWTGSIGALSGILHLDVANGTDQITGMLTTGEFTGSLLANRAVFSATNPAPWAGAYTTVLSAPDDPSVPAGLGWANVQISSTGWVALTGQLGDGSKFRQVVPISKYGTWPVFDVPNGLYSLVAGWVTMTNAAVPFSTGSMVSDVNADLLWYRPPIPASKLFSSGFSTQLTVVGSKYTAPAPGTTVIPVTDSSCNLTVVFGGGDLPGPVTNTVTLTITDQVINCGGGTLSMSLVPSRGYFGGAFTPPGATKPIRFGGLLLQNGAVGGGNFLGTDTTGYVTVEPIIEPAP